MPPHLIRLQLKSLNTLLLVLSGLFFATSDATAQFPIYTIENPQEGIPLRNFGIALAVDGDTMVVCDSPPKISRLSSRPSQAWVYRRDNNGVWQLEAELKVEETIENFGNSVSISGDTIIVGASKYHDDSIYSGAAFVFTRSGGVWTQQQKLIASDAAKGSRFGFSVAISGDTAIIGAPYHDDEEQDSGSAYVFVRNHGKWNQQQKLTAPNFDQSADFGRSVSISEKTAVVGARDKIGNDDPTYVFVNIDGKWIQQQRLTGDNTEDVSGFGGSVSVFEDTVVIGAAADRGHKAGSVYVFVRSDGTWIQQQKLTPNDEENEFFGNSVYLSGDTVIIGANNDVVPIEPGAAYIFTRTAGVWSQQQKLFPIDHPDHEYFNAFGSCVSISGDRAIVGAPWDSDWWDFSGSAYVYVRTGAGWIQEQKLVAANDENNPAEGDQFGNSVSVSENSIIIGASGDGYRKPRAGSAYVFTHQSGEWKLQQKLNAPDANESDQFGDSVAISGDTAIVGAPWDSYNDMQWAGSSYIFLRSGGKWTLKQKLTANDAEEKDHFGGQVAISGDTAFVSAAQSDDGGNNSGSVYVFKYVSGDWIQQQKLTASDAAAHDNFGHSVSISGDTVVVGAPYKDDLGNSVGSAYVFLRVDGEWVQQGKLVAQDAALMDEFGSSVSISGETIIVGVEGDDDIGLASGSAYLFERSGDHWVQQQKLTAPDDSGFEHFGKWVSIFGDRAIVAAHGNDSIYLYNRTYRGWSLYCKLTTKLSNSGSIDIDGDWIISGSHGAAYVFDLSPIPTAARIPWQLYK